jgi:hemolysin activation/secretion protein
MGGVMVMVEKFHAGRHPVTPVSLVGVFLGFCTAGSLALAQSVPDAGALLRETQRQPTQPDAPRPVRPPVTAPVDETAQRQDQALRFQVNAIVVQGATLISDDDLQNIVRGWLNRDIGIADLRAAAQAITDEYLRRGWYARALLPAQAIEDGRVRIDVLEGRLGAIKVDDGGQKTRMDAGLVVDTLTARQKPGEPLQLLSLERAIGVLGDTPGVAVKTVLAPGLAHGDTDVLVQIKDKPLLTSSFSLDNHGTRSTDAKRASANISLDNPGGRGDQVNLGTILSEGSQYLRLAYGRAVGNDGLRVGAQASALRYHLLNEFSALDARGTATTVGLTATYPIVRSERRNVIAGAALDARDYRNVANGAETSRKGSTVLTTNLTGDLSGLLGEGGFTLWALNLGLGRLDLSRNAVNQAADRAGPDTEGRFAKLGWNLAHLQPLSDKTSLWVAATGQFASKNLDSSEKFSLGGANGVRAYPALEANGDAGWLTNLELRQQITPELQLFGFYDYGRIRLNQNPNSSTALANGLNSYALKGHGLGLNWIKPGQYVLRIAVARRDGSNPAADSRTGHDTDGSKQIYRLWVGGTVYF